MRNKNRINEINQELEGFFYTDLKIILLGALFILIVAFVVVILLSKETWYFGFLFVGYFLIAIPLALFINDSERELLNEITILTIEDLEQVTVKVEHIQRITPAHPSACPQVELKSNENCMFVDFVGEGEISQVFIPLEKSIYADPENPLELTYYKANSKESTMILEMTDAGRNHHIYNRQWALGVSINE